MRPTLLGFRPPDERTAEYTAELKVTRDGKFNNAFEDNKQNPRGTNMPRAQRFENMPFYDRATGQSVFTGPGSYKVGDASKRLHREACPTVIVSIL